MSMFVLSVTWKGTVELPLLPSCSNYNINRSQIILEDWRTTLPTHSRSIWSWEAVSFLQGERPGLTGDSSTPCYCYLFFTQQVFMCVLRYYIMWRTQARQCCLVLNKKGGSIKGTVIAVPWKNAGSVPWETPFAFRTAWRQPRPSGSFRGPRWLKRLCISESFIKNRKSSCHTQMPGSVGSRRLSQFGFTHLLVHSSA